MAQELLVAAEKSASQARAYLRQCREDLAVLEQVLPTRRAAVQRAEEDYNSAVELLREAFSLFRDMMELSEDAPSKEPVADAA